MSVVLVELEQFRAVSTPSLGLLVGLRTPGNDVILGRCECICGSRDLPSLSSRGLPTPQWAESWDRVRGCLPGGCEMCGVCVGVGGEGVREVVRELLEKTDLPVAVKGRSLVVVVVEEANDVKAYHATDSATLQEVGVASVGDYLANHTHLFRVSSSLPVLVDLHQPTAGDLLSALKTSGPPFFLIPSLNLLLPHPPHKSHSSHSSHPHKTLRELLPQSLESEECTPVELLHDPGGGSVAPLTISITDGGSKMADLHLPIDTLALVHLDLTPEEVGVVLREAVEHQLQAVVLAMLWKPCSVYNVAIHHFPPSPQHHLSPLSIPYPHSPVASPHAPPLNDSQLVSVRKSWHEALGLPLDVPKLRLTSRHCFTPPSCHGPQLVCPHSVLSCSPKGTVAMVTGKYAYYHYMQDGFNDKGWGCAYRSLQTLWSWFLFQGFTALATPTHQQIQEALVATGDKPAGFAGSKEWIGSFEVSTALNHLLGVECRIHHVSSGGEMSGVGRVLLHHFTTHGTPVMVGGGVLAHSILGVDYNTSSGDIWFLILDPHYTGKEDLKIITNKGWCGWKPISFWDSKAHYNMCMPQRPREF